MTKDVIAAILERRSTRKFKDNQVPRATIGRIIDAGRWAPSAGNIQPWQFFVVYNEQKRRELSTAALNQRFIAEAPVVIVICVNPEMSAAKYGGRGQNLYIFHESGAVVQNMLLAAEGYGLGACWVGAFEEPKVIKALELSDELLPVAIIPIGYADQEPRPPARRPVDELVKVFD